MVFRSGRRGPRQFSLLFAVTGVCLLFAGDAFAVSGHCVANCGTDSGPPPPPPPPPPLDPSHDVYFVSAIVRGEVKLDFGGGQALFGQNMTQVRMTEGTRLVTGPSGSATLTLMDGMELRVGPNTELNFSDIKFFDEKDPFSIRLLRGITYFVVSHVRGFQYPDEPKVKLYIGDLGFRGTEADIETDTDGSGSIKMISGEAELTPYDGGAPIELHANQMLTFTNFTQIFGPTQIR